MRLVLFICAIIVCCQSAILCPEDACGKIQCDQLLTAESCSANGGSLKKKGGFCGCCDLCVQQLEKGDNCMVTELLGAPSTSECSGDLYCDPITQKCATPSCAMEKQRLASQPLMLGRFIPSCDSDGTYAGVQCSGSQCYCVDTEGQKIGYDHSMKDVNNNGTCQCARDKDEYMSRNIIGRLFHCTDEGEYESRQCHGSVCYCVDIRTGKQQVSSGVHISARNTLKC